MTIEEFRVRQRAHYDGIIARSDANLTRMGVDLATRAIMKAEQSSRLALQLEHDVEQFAKLLRGEIR